MSVWMNMRFSVLDSLRGICAIFVVLFHIEVIGRIYSGSLHGLKIIENSFFFVDFFFVLSGFVIAHTYFNKINSSKELWVFIIRRFGRVYPLHFVVLVGFVVLEIIKSYIVHHGEYGGSLVTEPFSEGSSVEALFTNILLIQAFHIHNYPTWNTPSWSIGVEFYTYIIFAIFVYLSCGQRWLKYVVPSVIAMMSALIVYLFSPKYMNAVYDYAIFRCLYGFFVGVIASLIFDRVGPYFKQTFILTTLTEMLVVSLTIYYIAWSGPYPSSILSPLLFLAVILVFSAEGGMLSKILRARPFQFLGKRSYTIYISHVTHPL